MSNDVRIPIESDADIVAARQEGRRLGGELGFSRTELALIATAISEVARNIISYARRGEVTVSVVQTGGRRGLTIVARDEGPGIADIGLAMQDGYSTTKSLGLGLPGARRLMDDFHIESALGKGTTITMHKWLP